ncbi:hypothetical protein [Streptosporangium sp. NPDC048865]|uniref:DUF7507 domain-containing protein n=1 Tax=Streptosporangium sp. NPDC048865 TaxID=3155766 RepID=UPI00343A071F
MNTATASGATPTGAVIGSNASTATVTAAGASSLTLVKTASPSTMTRAGQAVTYSHVVTNTGGTTLTAVSVTDTAFSGRGTPPVVTCPVTTLAPRASTTCTGTYTVAQADIDAGSVVNTAVASGTPPEGPAIRSAPSTATVTATQDPRLTLSKSGTPSRVSAAGQRIVYSYVITNTGNVVLTDIGVRDTSRRSGVPPVITCPVTTLEPGESTTCSGTYVVTWTDIVNGSIENTATASGNLLSGPVVSSGASTATVVAGTGAAGSGRPQAGGVDRQKNKIRNKTSNTTRIKITDRHKKKKHHRHRGGHQKRRR